MPILDDLGLFLQTHGFGILGQSLFLGMIPPDSPSAPVQDALLVLFEIPGPPPELVHDILGPAVEVAGIQCRWRGAPFDYAAARAQAGAAFRLLASQVNTTINGVFYRQLLMLSSPHALPADEWSRPTIIFEMLAARDGQAP